MERQKWVGTIQDSEFQNTNTKGEAGRTPQISVIMPVYNGEKYIARAVQSVYAQDVPLELIIIDDGSVDGTREALIPWENRPDFVYIKNERNLGAAGSRNRGVSVAKHNSINCSSVLILREVALEFPMEHDDSHEDYITWLKVVRKYGHATGINRPYLKYRLSQGGKSRNKAKSAIMTYQVYRYVGYGPVRSACFFLSYALHGIWKYR